MKEVFVDILGHEEQEMFDVSLAGTSYCDGSYKIYRPDSKVFCIEYVLEGEGTIVTRGKTFTAQKGDTYFLLKGENHEYFSDAERPWTKLWVNFDGNAVWSLIDMYALNDVTVIKCDTYDYFEKMHTVLQDKTRSFDDMLDECFAIMHRLFMKVSRTLKNNNVLAERKTNDDAEILKKHIDRKTCEKMNIEKLAQYIYKSPSQTIRIFKKAYGITPYEYHLKNKMEKAVLLLQSTSMPIKEIAYYLGFGDEHYFSNVFKKKMGKSPNEYRKRK